MIKKGFMQNLFLFYNVEKFFQIVYYIKQELINMSIVKNPELKDSGLKKIEWVKSYMPVLSAIGKRFEKERPFENKTIAMSIHLEAKTAYLALTLAAGGARVYATGCNPLSTQDDVAAALASLISKNLVTINGAEAINKSYPSFAEDFARLGGQINVK